ncbi:unnamed protein product, partial [Prorocentrum cordatum]
MPELVTRTGFAPGAKPVQRRKKKARGVDGDALSPGAGDTSGYSVQREVPHGGAFPRAPGAAAPPVPVPIHSESGGREEDWRDDGDWDDEYIVRIAEKLIADKIVPYRDALVGELVAVVSSAVVQQVQDFGAQLAAHSASAAKLAEGVKHIFSVCSNAPSQFCRGKLGTFARRFQEQIDGQTVKLRALDAKVSEKDASINAMCLKRDVGSTVVRVVSAKLANFDAVKQVLSDWIVLIGLQADCFDTVSPVQVSKHFAIQFAGAAAPAARRAAQVFGAQRLAPGQWRRLRLIKREIQGRKLRGAFRDVDDSKRWFFDRDRGCLMVGWDPVLRASPQPGNIATDLSWADNVIVNLGLDKAALIAAAKAIVAPPETTEWPDGLRACASYCVGSAVKGGVAIIPPAGCSAVAQPAAFVPARVQRAALRLGGAILIRCDVRDRDLAHKQLRRIFAAMESDFAAAQRDPIRMLVMVRCDFNFSYRASYFFAYLVGLSRKAKRSARVRRAGCALFAASRTSERGVIADELISDRSARRAKSAQRRLRPRCAQGIPRRIFESSYFQELLRNVSSQLDYASPSPPRQVELRKWVVLEASSDASDIATDEAVKTGGLMGHGALVFSIAPIDEDIAQACISQRVPQLDVAEAGLAVLSGALMWIMRGGALFNSSNITWQVWLAEGGAAEGSLSVGCGRAAGPVRVLGLRGADVELIGATLDLPLGKLFGVDALELDAASRVCSNLPSASRDMPALVALCFGAAFSRLSLEFARVVFAQMGAPFAFISVLDQLCPVLEAVVMPSGFPARAWWVSSGIVQRCSLSGSTYAAVAACFLFVPQNRLGAPRHGLARACADDIGCVVRSLRSLCVLADVALIAAAVVALSLKLGNSSLRSPLRRVVSTLVHLGLVPGPAAGGGSCRRAPGMKVKVRSKRVGSNALAVSRLANNCAMRATHVLSYVAQYRMMPRWLLREELVALSRSLRAPLGVFNVAAWLQLRAAG